MKELQELLQVAKQLPWHSSLVDYK